MPKQKNDTPPIVRLQYFKDDLIVKEGDYGISIYEIISGKLGAYNQSGDADILVNTLVPGEIIGEMSFLTGGFETRSSTIRALEHSILEVWHPSMIFKEYKQMPAMIKEIVGQSLKRLLRANKILAKLEASKVKTREIEENEPWSSKRLYYRKELEIKCLYSPVNYQKTVRLSGEVKDISRSGLGMKISDVNTFSHSHQPGDEFIASLVLPTGKKLDVEIKIVSVRKMSEKSKFFLGMKFTNLSEEAIKVLGFFLMP